MKYALIVENRVIAIRENEENGMVEVPDDIVCGQILLENGDFSKLPSEEVYSPTVQEQIYSLESQITQRNLRSAMLGDQWAIDHITSIENQIAELRPNA